MAESIDLIGHEGILKFFSQSIQLNRLCSTYLFSGSPGVGKRVAARYIARRILCKVSKDEKPCEQCESCQAFLAETNPYFTERNFIKEKKSNESAVDVVRSFIEEVESLARSGHTIVYSIPNFEQYSIQVQNALLKILEEPPEGIYIILTTDKPQFILETIHSRCQHLRFSLLSNTELKAICEANDIRVNQEYSLGEGRVDLASKFSQETYQKLYKYAEQLIQRPPVDYLSAADDISKLTSDIEPKNDDIKDRDRIIEFVKIFEKVFIARMVNKTRTHFVAIQVLNTTIEELLSARKHLERSGHVMLSLDQYLNIAISRLQQMNKFARMKEVS